MPPGTPVIARGNAPWRSRRRRANATPSPAAEAVWIAALASLARNDDGVVATPRDGGLWLSPPDTIRDMIEARGVGILASPASPAWARAVVDLDKVEKARLPEARETVIAGARLPQLRKVESPAFPAMLKLYLLGGVYGDARSRSED